MDFQTIALGPIGIVTMIIGIVEAAKQFGLKGKASLGLGIGLGVCFGTLIELINQGVIPEVVIPYVSAVVTGLTLGLAAVGLYALGKRAAVGLGDAVVRGRGG